MGTTGSPPVLRSLGDCTTRSSPHKKSFWTTTTTSPPVLRSLEACITLSSPPKRSFWAGTTRSPPVKRSFYMSTTTSPPVLRSLEDCTTPSPPVKRSFWVGTTRSSAVFRRQNQGRNASCPFKTSHLGQICRRMDFQGDGERDRPGCTVRRPAGWNGGGNWWHSARSSA